MQEHLIWRPNLYYKVPPDAVFQICHISHMECNVHLDMYASYVYARILLLSCWLLNILSIFLPLAVHACLLMVTDEVLQYLTTLYMLFNGQSD